MARRATSLTKGRSTTPQEPAAELVAGNAPRRGNKPKLANMPPGATSDAFFPGGEEPAASTTGSGSKVNTKARRVRKPRSVEMAAETLTTNSADAEEVAAPAPEFSTSEKNEGSDIVEAPADKAAASLANADSKASSSAARWDAGTGTASFDWPVIVAVAASDGPNQAMAKLLLAARAEGANSRWPF